MGDARISERANVKALIHFLPPPLFHSFTHSTSNPIECMGEFRELQYEGVLRNCRQSEKEAGERQCENEWRTKKERERERNTDKVFSCVPNRM